MRLRIGMMRCLLTLHSPVQSSAAYALLVLGLFGLAVPEDLHKCSNNIDFGAMIPPDCTTRTRGSNIDLFRCRCLIT